MRCTACDAALTNAELTHTNPTTHLPEDLCNKCLGSISDIVNLTELPYYDEIVIHGDCC